jgi:hypothetical protein
MTARLHECCSYFLASSRPEAGGLKEHGMATEMPLTGVTQGIIHNKVLAGGGIGDIENEEEKVSLVYCLKQCANKDKNYILLPPCLPPN